jgi:hypothetical protein
VKATVCYGGWLVLAGSGSSCGVWPDVREQARSYDIGDPIEPCGYRRRLAFVGASLLANRSRSGGTVSTMHPVSPVSFLSDNEKKRLVLG